MSRTRTFPQELIEKLEEQADKMSEYDARQVRNWRNRLDDQDPFDRQDLSDMRSMVDSL